MLSRVGANKRPCQIDIVSSRYIVEIVRKEEVGLLRVKSVWAEMDRQI